jgi:DNA-binding XRE family transcriptional regulator
MRKSLGSVLTHAQSVGPGVADCMGGGTATPFVFLTNMGHARNRPERLAEKLLQIREALGLSQREIADRLSERAGVKITSKNISKYERDRSVPFIEVVLAYARLANVEMNQIVDDDLELALPVNL